MASYSKFFEGALVEGDIHGVHNCKYLRNFTGQKTYPFFDSTSVFELVKGTILTKQSSGVMGHV